MRRADGTIAWRGRARVQCEPPVSFVGAFGARVSPHSCDTPVPRPHGKRGSGGNDQRLVAASGRRKCRRRVLTVARIEFPNGARFAFTIIDDTDVATRA